MLTTWKKLEAETTYLVDIPRVGEELAADGLELTGARLEHLHDDMWFTLRQRGECACRAPRWSAVLVMSRSTNGKACRDILGKIRQGERFSPGGPCRIVGRRKKSDASPPRMTRAPSELRASIPAARSWSQETSS
jgi:hypothetical protein